MADVIRGKYVEYYPSQFFREKAEEFYSNKKFEDWYNNHPDRMTPSQIKLCGYDRMRSQLWSDYLDKKFDSIHISEFETAKMVLEQILKPIKKVCGNIVKVEVNEGSIKHGYNPKVTLPTITIGEYMTHDKPEGNLRVFITLNDDENAMFQLCYETAYYCGERNVDDVELVEEIKKYVKFIKEGKEPTSYPDKVCHKVENQYNLYSGKTCIDLYDVEMVQMYHTLAKACNEAFGTDFPYSQKCIDRLSKHAVWGNIQMVGGFYFKGPWYADKTYKLNQFYYYKDSGRCEATYGDDWTKEDIISLVRVLKPYVLNGFFYETSRKVMGKKYADYDRIGIGYAKKPDYFLDLLWEE